MGRCVSVSRNLQIFHHDSSQFRIGQEVPFPLVAARAESGSERDPNPNEVVSHADTTRRESRRWRTWPGFTGSSRAGASPLQEGSETRTKLEER